MNQGDDFTPRNGNDPPELVLLMQPHVMQTALKDLWFTRDSMGCALTDLIAIVYDSDSPCGQQFLREHAPREMQGMRASIGVSVAHRTRFLVSIQRDNPIPAEFASAEYLFAFVLPGGFTFKMGQAIPISTGHVTKGSEASN